MSKYDPNYVFVTTYYSLGVKTIIYNNLRQVLLLKRSDKSSRAHGWDLAGGAVENGEDPMEAAIREAKEETGLDVTNLKLLVTDTYSQEKGHIVIIGCTAETKSNKVTLTWEHESYKWMDIDKALKLDMPKTHKKFLRAFSNRTI